MTHKGRTLELCADDYGMSPAVSSGILRLVRAHRLGAVSCLVGGPSWPADASMLAGEPAVAQGRVQVGLHFCLTEGRVLAPALAQRWPQPLSLRRLIARAHLGLLPQDALRAEWHAQVDRFVAAFGRPPDFVDGHQHVHHLPGVRAIVIEGVVDLSAAAGHALAVRATGLLPGPGFGLKRALIAATGGRAMQRALDQRSIPHNRSLFGVYDFGTHDYRDLMRAWLAALPPRGALLFCHPGDADTMAADPIAPARTRELAYLESAAFADDLAEAGVALGRAW